MGNYYNLPWYSGLLGSTLVFLTVMIVIIYLFSIAIFGRWLAIEKGYSSISWFWLCFFFNISALIVLVGAPNRNKKKSIVEEIYQEVKELKEILANKLIDSNSEQSNKENLYSKENERTDRLNKYKNILNNPEIEKESLEILRMYGKVAQERFIQTKMQTEITIEEEKKLKKILNDIGYVVTIEKGKWTIQPKDNNGLIYYAYSKEELLDKMKSIIENIKKVERKE